MPRPQRTDVPSSEPGRRDNGLAAADWGALVDLDPRLSDSLLRRLAEAGVAAYVEPAGGVDTVHRAATLPARPLDRLWVDPDRAEAARTVINALTGELDGQELVSAVPRGSARRVLSPPRLGSAPDPVDDDAMFEQIVAGFHTTEKDPPVPHWPVEEDLGGAPTAATDAQERAPHRPRQDDLPGWVEPEEIEPDETDHFVPPPPPPLTWFRATTVAYVLAMVLGVLVAFAPDLMGLSAGNDTRLLGMVLTAVGAGMLIWQMRDNSNDDPDDGAVV